MTISFDGGNIIDVTRTAVRQGRHGVPRGGPCDPLAAELAVRLVGTSTVYEITMIGPRVTANMACSYAYVGADCELHNGHTGELRAGESIRLGALRNGARGYLSVGPAMADHGVLRGPLPWLNGGPVRALCGPHGMQFADLCARRWTVATASNRMGLRLTGQALASQQEIRSYGMVGGAIQVPPSGEPIVLMPDHGTTGGYPVVAVIISADLPKLAYLRPGDNVWITGVSLDEANEAYAKRMQWVASAVIFPTRW